MVRTHHHDSSQFAAALFGGGDTTYPPPKSQQPVNHPATAPQPIQRRYSDGEKLSKEERRAQWENEFSDVSNNPFFAGDSGRKGLTHPADKPPDLNHHGSYGHYTQQSALSLPPYAMEQQNNQQQYTPPSSQQQDYFPYMKQSLQPGTLSSSAPQTSHHQQFVQQNQQFMQQSPHQQQFMPQNSIQPQFMQQTPQHQLNLQLSQQQLYAQQLQHQQTQDASRQNSFQPGMPGQLVPPMTNGGMFLPTPPESAQYYPVQIPGYGNGVYFVMSPQMPLDGSRKLSTSAPNVNEMVLQSLSSGSSLTSAATTRWSNTPDTQTSSLSTASLSGGLARAKWGEKGIGVGRLWNPDDTEPNTSSRDLPPPQWANIQEEGGLPGTSRSSGERTHTRGQVILDSQEMAEKQRRQRQAQETQRVIQQQLEEKKRLQAEEDERDRKEAAMWEAKMKEQQDKERKEMEIENNKRKEKQEADEKKQRKMQNAIQEAAERAKREKEELKYEKAQKFAQATNNDDTRPETSLSNKAGVSFNLNQQEAVQESSTVTNPPHKPLPETQITPVKAEVNEPSPAKITLPDVVSTAQVGGLDQAQKLAILTALGINPEYLLSSGVFDKSTFMALLGPTPLIPKQEDSSQYVRNVMLTPTKFRKARDCGVQCDESPPPLKSRGERKPLRRRVSRRSKPVESENSSSSEKPQWGRHKSDRPYRKQSEKDPYSGRRFRNKKHTRSLSVSDTKDSHTDPDSDNQLIAMPRRRKTWGESLQESLSSDLSRSPSPRLHRRGPIINLPRGPPPIKQPLTPNLQQDLRIDSPHTILSPGGVHRPKSSMETPIKTPPDRKVSADHRRSGDHDDDKDVVIGQPTPLRPSSPPVPAIAGNSTFNIPEYPPGVDPPPVTEMPLPPPRRKTALRSSSRMRRQKANPRRLSQSSSVVETPEGAPLSPIERKSSLPDLLQNDEESNQDKEELKEDLRPLRTSVAPKSVEIPNENSEKDGKMNSITRPSSSVSRPRSAMRLPPMEDQRSRPATASNVRRSPSAATIRSRSSETLSLAALTLNVDDQITPVEVSSKITNQTLRSLSSTPTSLSTNISPVPFSRKKKDSADSGFSGEISRPSSANSSTSNIEEQLGGSISSGGYELLKRELAKDPNNIDNLNINPEKWIVLRSIANVRENFWRKNEDLSLQATKKTDSTL